MLKMRNHLPLVRKRWVAWKKLIKFENINKSNTIEWESGADFASEYLHKKSFFKIKTVENAATPLLGNDELHKISSIQF